jgi:hypothetical protein
MHLDVVTLGHVADTTEERIAGMDVEDLYRS